MRRHQLPAQKRTTRTDLQQGAGVLPEREVVACLDALRGRPALLHRHAREDSVSFFNARCKFKNRDYDTASALFDDFRRKFGRSAFIEDAEGMYALCFYYLSPGPSRDQT